MLLAPIVSGLHQTPFGKFRTDALAGRHHAVSMQRNRRHNEGWQSHHQQLYEAQLRKEKLARENAALAPDTDSRTLLKTKPPPTPPPMPPTQVVEPVLVEGDIDAMEASLEDALLAHFKEQEASLEDALLAYLPAVSAPALSAPAVPAPAVPAQVAVDDFEAAIQLCEQYECRQGHGGDPGYYGGVALGLSEEVPRLMRKVFDQDFDQLLLREKAVTNLTCMCSTEEGCGSALFDKELLNLPLKPGRVCEGGACGDACSRVTFPLFASHEECKIFREELEVSMTPPFHHFELAKCAFRSIRTTMIFVRLVERMRRAIAHEYGLPLETVVPAQAFVACLVGDPEVNFEDEKAEGSLHADESSFAQFHYSCVLYLSTQGEDFEGGTFTYNDPSPSLHAWRLIDPQIKGNGNEAAATGDTRVLTPLIPSIGSAVIFSSGWENMHEVLPLVSGTRFAVPAFFRTQPARQAGAASLGTGNDAAIAEELWTTIMQPTSGKDVQQFMLNWHELLAGGREL